MLYPRNLLTPELFDSGYRAMKEVEISREPVELYKILKFEGIVSSGAEAKSMIAEGQVVVNGHIETRKRNKIMSGDIIECGQYKLHIKVK